MKFDFRVYVMLESLDPLVMHLYKDGMVRFCTQPYVAPTPENLRQTYMHLTNYHLNKNNTDGFKLSGLVNVPVPIATSSPRHKDAAAGAREEKTADDDTNNEDDDNEGDERETAAATDDEPRGPTEMKQVYREVPEDESSKRSIRLVLAQLRAAGIQLDDQTFWDQVQFSFLSSPIASTYSFIPCPFACAIGGLNSTKDLNSHLGNLRRRPIVVRGMGLIVVDMYAIIGTIMGALSNDV
jgi:hypothetical protein